MFKINRYKYIDIDTRNKFEVYSRTQEFADKLIERVNKCTVFNLRPAKIFFCKKMITEKPPYSIELEQLQTIERWEENENERARKNNNVATNK